MEQDRRQFLRTSALASASALVPHFNEPMKTIHRQSNVTIEQVDSQFEREPLIRPFGFKGGYMHEIWQTVAMIKSSSGHQKLGLGTQNVLWSDARVFSAHSETGGNALMYALTERALQLSKGKSFQTPIELQEVPIARSL